MCFTDPMSLEHWRSSPLVSRLKDGLSGPGLPESEYFEYRLGSSSVQVDYLLAISRGNAVSAHRWAANLSVRGELGHQSHWRRLASLFHAWADAKSLISLHVPTIWLEFDGLCGGQPQVAAPSISLCLLPGYRAWDAAPRAEATRCLEIAECALERLAVDLNAAQSDALASCFHALPEGAAWIHASAMLGREPAALKLYGSFPREALGGFLRAVGWRGDLGAVESILECEYSGPLVGADVFVDINLDNFRDAARCSLGLAVGQRSVEGPVRQLARSAILNRWRNAGLCCANEVASAQAWLGAATTCRSIGEKKTENRFLDLKLVWQAGAPLTAKAYLGYSA